MKISVMFKGEVVVKNTARSDVTVVIVSLHKGKRVISGMYKNYAAAVKGLSGFCNPAWTENEIVEII